MCTVFWFSFSFRLFLGPPFCHFFIKYWPQEKSKRKRKSKNCKHNTWPSRYLWIPEKNIFGKVYHFGEIVFQKSSKIMIFPSCVIKNRDQKKSQNSGMTFLVFLNIFFTISMYQLKKNLYGYIHLKLTPLTQLAKHGKMSHLQTPQNFAISHETIF